jgi:hypothetical protein
MTAHASTLLRSALLYTHRAQQTTRLPSDPSCVRSHEKGPRVLERRSPRLRHHRPRSQTARSPVAAVRAAAAGSGQRHVVLGEQQRGGSRPPRALPPARCAPRCRVAQPAMPCCIVLTCCRLRCAARAGGRRRPASAHGFLFRQRHEPTAAAEGRRALPGRGTCPGAARLRDLARARALAAPPAN